MIKTLNKVDIKGTYLNNPKILMWHADACCCVAVPWLVVWPLLLPVTGKPWHVVPKG